MSQVHNQHATFCVAVGASAGGVEALGEMFTRACSDENVCYLVVLHLAPDHPSQLAEVLRRQTSLEVEAASDGLVPRGNTIYVVEPRTSVRCDGQRLHVESRAPGRYLHRPIDLAFESMASHWGVRCAAVVLSGTGTDGSRGARAVNEAGGFVLAQEPASAAFDGMPRALIDTGLVDTVLPPSEICAELKELLATGVGSQPPDVLARHEAELTRILRALEQHTSVDFSLYKPASIARRIERRRGIVRANSLSDYVRMVETDQEEAKHLSAEMLIGVTHFFREPQCIQELSTALAGIVQSRGDEPLRVWVAGCSTGEEAYTVGIVISEVLRDCGRPLDFKLFATDVNEGSLAIASAGRYSAASIADVPPDLLPHYFEPDPARGYVAAGFLRERILFARHDLLSDAPFSNVDVITCRNVFIYLVADAQTRVSKVFGFALRRGGLLWMGSSESPKPSEYPFEPVSKGGHVFRPAQTEGSSPAPARPGAGTRRGEFSSPSPPRGRTAQQLIDGPQLVALAADLLPPHLIVDENYALLFHSGGARRYLELQEGQASLDVRRLFSRHVRTLLISAMDRHRAGETNDFLFPGLELPHAEPEPVAMRVRRLPREPAHESLTVVFFETASPERPTNVEPAALATEAVQARIDSLEQELERAQARLQESVSKLELSTEEAQGTNEQLLASNEELQAVNEELQSVNEELHTVNAELQSKVEELWRVTADMDEVLATVDMGIIVLDDDLRIRRFNQRAAAFVRVVAYDQGRPFSHLNNSFSGTPLLDDCARAAREREPLERLLFSDDASKVLFRVKPMSQSVNRGVLLSFSDVSSLETLEDAAHRLSQAVEQLDSPVVLVDTTGVITYANRCFAELARRDVGFLPGTSFADLMPSNGRDDFEQALAQLRQNQIWRGTSTLDVPGGPPVEEEVRMRPLLSKTGKVIGAARFSASLPSVGRRVRILVIEDDPVDVELLESRLAQEGIRNDLEAIASGESALDSLMSADPDALPDLILLDLGLPGMSGEDFLAALRRVPRLAHIPTVVLTSFDDGGKMREVNALGAAAYVVKPMDMNGLRNVVSRLDDFGFSVVRYPGSKAHAASAQ